MSALLARPAARTGSRRLNSPPVRSTSISRSSSFAWMEMCRSACRKLVRPTRDVTHRPRTTRRASGVSKDLELWLAVWLQRPQQLCPSPALPRPEPRPRRLQGVHLDTPVLSSPVRLEHLSIFAISRGSNTCDYRPGRKEAFRPRGEPATAAGAGPPGDAHVGARERGERQLLRPVVQLRKEVASPGTVAALKPHSRFNLGPGGPRQVLPAAAPDADCLGPMAELRREALVQRSSYKRIISVSSTLKVRVCSSPIFRTTAKTQRYKFGG